MSSLSWYPLYPGDYGRDTGHLSMIEDGAYRRLLDHYYSTGAPLPKDKESIYRICRALQPCERKAVNTVLEEFFALQEDGYHNRRADLELARQLALAGKGRHAPIAAGSSTETHFSTGSPHPQSQPQTTKERTLPFSPLKSAKERATQTELCVGAAPLPSDYGVRVNPKTLERIEGRRQARQIVAGC